MGLFDTVWHKLLRRPYRLAVIDEGEGRPVILLHGLAANKENWLRLIKELSPDKWRILAPDLMGFGASPKPQWSKYDVTEHSRMVLAMIKQKRLKGPIMLVGHSMGCLVAAHLTANNPRLIGRLVLYEPPLLSSMPEFPDHAKRSARYKVLFEYIASHPQLAHLESKMLWRVARKISGLYLDQEEWVPFERSLRNTIMDQRTYEELKAVPVPTDIIYGRMDMIVIRQGIKTMFNHNKNIKLHLVTDIHGISARSSRYLAGILEGVRPKRHRRRKTK